MEKVCFSCTEWHRTEENGEPQWFILNLPLDDDELLDPDNFLLTGLAACFVFLFSPVSLNSLGVPDCQYCVLVSFCIELTIYVCLQIMKCF